MKNLIELTIRQTEDNAYELHYVVPNFSSSKKESERGVVVASSLARAVDRIDWITRYLRNPIKGKPMHEAMAANVRLQEMQNATKKNDI
jgi:hypothetical protein